MVSRSYYFIHQNEAYTCVWYENNTYLGRPASYISSEYWTNNIDEFEAVLKKKWFPVWKVSYTRV